MPLWRNSTHGTLSFECYTKETDLCLISLSTIKRKWLQRNRSQQCAWYIINATLIIQRDYCIDEPTANVQDKEFFYDDEVKDVIRNHASIVYCMVWGELILYIHLWEKLIWVWIPKSEGLTHKINNMVHIIYFSEKCKCGTCTDKI